MENLSSRNVPKMVNQTITSDVEKVGKAVLDAAFKVHTALGPGLLESVYETTLSYELRKSGLAVANQLSVQIVYYRQNLEKVNSVFSQVFQKKDLVQIVFTRQNIQINMKT